MKKDSRSVLLKSIAASGRLVTDLAENWNCKGIPEPVLQTWDTIFKAVFNEFFGQVDSMSVARAAKRYGVCSLTVRNKITELGLTPPQKVAEANLSMIPVDTMLALDEYYGKKP